MKEKDIIDEIIAGRTLTDDEVYTLVETSSTETLLDMATRLTSAFMAPVFDSCSIINARSGKCPEDCKWCAQSVKYDTGCNAYEIVPREECLHVARYNSERGIRRIALVTSGRWMKGKGLDEMCSIYKEIGRETGLYLCASMGLLSRDELLKLRDASVKRYHCNLETAPSYFSSLCTTHTMEDKIKTIGIARELGFEICSGGIIGMGETERQRVEFALKLREIAPNSIPLNILCPIPGTPLADAEPLTEEEILRAVAIFRIVNPRVSLRFAGGRTKLSREGQVKAMKIGVNGGIVGDLLTTVGSTIDEDVALASDSGYKWRE